MKFLSIYRSAETNVPPSAERIAAMGNLIDEFTQSGVLLGTEGCLPSALGARVRLASGKVTVTDGPFTEAKEVVGGFALLDVSSRQQAIDLTRRFLAVAGDGECELRQIATLEDFGGALTPEQVEAETHRRGKMAVRA